FDDAVHAGDRADLVADRVAQTDALIGIGYAAVDEDCRSFLAVFRRDRESGDVTMVEAGQLLHRPLDILRPVVLAVDDDHVLRPADDEQVAIGHVAHVAGVEPTIDEALVGRFLVAEVGMHDARAAAPDLADLVVLLRFAVLTADFDFHVGQRLAAIDDRPVARRARQIAAGP